MVTLTEELVTSHWRAGGPHFRAGGPHWRAGGPNYRAGGPHWRAGGPLWWASGPSLKSWCLTFESLSLSLVTIVNNLKIIFKFPNLMYSATVYKGLSCSLSVDWFLLVWKMWIASRWCWLPRVWGLPPPPPPAHGAMLSHHRPVCPRLDVAPIWQSVPWILCTWPNHPIPKYFERSDIGVSPSGAKR